MKYCDKCGTSLKDDDCYCSECGAAHSTTKKTVKRTRSHVFICIVAVLVMVNIVCIPFLCNKYWSISEDIHQYAQSFLDTIEDLSDGYYSNGDVPIDVLYYFGGPTCALFIFISALGKSAGACKFGSLAGIGLSLYIFYQIYLGTTRWYVGLHDAQLTFGYYISCVGFIAMFMASLSKGQE